MKKYKLIINNKIAYDNIYEAKTFFDRLKGLIFNSQQKSYGLIFKNCNSIHTCFMKYKLDVFCLNKDFEVIKIYKNLKPFRFILPQRKVCHILEVPSIYHMHFDSKDTITVQ